MVILSEAELESHRAFFLGGSAALASCCAVACSSDAESPGRSSRKPSNAVGNGSFSCTWSVRTVLLLASFLGCPMAVTGQGCVARVFS